MKKEYTVGTVVLNHDFKDYENAREMVERYHLNAYTGVYSMLMQVQEILKNHDTEYSKESVEEYNKLKEFEASLMVIYLNTEWTL